MKQIKTFDNFLSESSATQVPVVPQRVSDDSGGNPSLRNPRRENYKVTIKIEGRTQDSEFGATIEGVWPGPLFAAFWAHFKTMEFLEGRMDPIDAKRIEDNFRLVRDMEKVFKSYPSPLEREAATDKIKKGNIEPDHFSKPGEPSEVSVEISKVPAGTPIGGFIADSYRRKI
jgi:hypothetical protein